MSFEANSRGPRARVPMHRRGPRGPVARLATDLPGSALIGRVSHPLDDSQDFGASACTSFPTSIAWSHCKIHSRRGSVIAKNCTIV